MTNVSLLDRIDPLRRTHGTFPHRAIAHLPGPPASLFSRIVRAASYPTQVGPRPYVRPRRTRRPRRSGPLARPGL